jgi:hypothetical protein
MEDCRTRTNGERRGLQHAGAERSSTPLGVTAQRETDLAVREQLDGGELRGDQTLDALATVTVAGIARDVVMTGKSSLS